MLLQPPNGQPTLTLAGKVTLTVAVIYVVGWISIFASTFLPG
jgi:hypothetical protein